jgi:hypothetical protein
MIFLKFLMSEYTFKQENFEAAFFSNIKLIKYMSLIFHTMFEIRIIKNLLST